ARLDAAGGVFVGVGGATPRVGLLCSGQGGPVADAFGFLGRRFPDVERAPGAWMPLPPRGVAGTAVAQPNVVRASLAALRALALLGVAPDLRVRAQPRQ